jgi:HPt (histidine-containing phosphotransfer) domain-containing protein
MLDPMSASELRPRTNTRPTPQESPIDLTELYRLGDTASGDTSRHFVHDIIELFLTLTPDIYATAKAAFADGDAQSVARAAHKLKSQAAYFGARRMVNVCKQIEQHGYSGELSRCERLLDDLEDELDRVVAALQPHRHQSASNV